MGWILFFTVCWQGIQNMFTTVLTAISTFFINIWTGIQNVVVTIGTAIQLFRDYGVGCHQDGAYNGSYSDSDGIHYGVECH